MKAKYVAKKHRKYIILCLNKRNVMEKYNGFERFL